MNQPYRNKILLIDDAFLLEVHNLQRKTNQAVKHPEPVVKLDDPWHEKHDVFGNPNVLYDDQEQLFKMWYTTYIEVVEQYWEQGAKQCYAVSEDGIHWEKPILNMIEVNGSTENNYIFPPMRSLEYSIFLDPSDPPSRRYKMIFQVRSKETFWAEFHSPLCIAYSADGIHWDRPQHVNPVLRGVNDFAWGVMYDPDRRKYLLFTRRVPNLPRDISLYESFDLVNWQDMGRVLVPGDEHDPPELFNFQSMTPFLYEDFYLGVVGAHHSLPEAETYEVFNKPPQDYPSGDILGRVNVQLAYSRDGRTWSRPVDRAAIIPVGQPGSPDEGMVFVPVSSPIIRNGETWIYYRAFRTRHNWWDTREYIKKHDGDVRDAECGMLAIMPEDHWVSLDAGSEEGWFLSKPYAPPSQLLVNADAEGGSIEAEFLTPYGQPVEGFTRADCIGISANGKDQEIKWKGNTSPRDLNEKYRGGLCLKFYLKNAKLYSYSLIEPDPDGTIKRYWDSARWNEAILHRSNNWGRASNAPAGGLPQPTGTQNTSGTRFGPNPRADAKWS